MRIAAPLRVLLADDHAIVRKGIREFLEEDGEVTVVAEASGGAEAVRLAGEHRPGGLGGPLPARAGLAAALVWRKRGVKCNPTLGSFMPSVKS